MTAQGAIDQQFKATAEEFKRVAEERYSDIGSMAAALRQPPAPASTVLVKDSANLQEAEAREIHDELRSGHGVLQVVSLADRAQQQLHPIINFHRSMDQHGFSLGFPVDHPMEQHQEALSRFGAWDGTLKLYDLPLQEGIDKYREQAETRFEFDAHNDGLGYAGRIHVSVMALDQPPLAGGYTYFQNLIRFGLSIAKDDRPAFEALFLPDAITALRPRGKGAIRVTAPVFFLGPDGQPQCFYRLDSGEYRMTWRQDDALTRAREYLASATYPFAPGSRFTQLMRSGDLLLVDNRHCVHGRTPFSNPPGKVGRVLARKWFVPSLEDADYRHVPGMAMRQDLAEAWPERFGAEVTSGEWHYDEALDANVQVLAQ